MPQAASFDSILEQCRDLVSELVSDALLNMHDKADNALTAFGRQARDPETNKVYKVTRDKILLQREAIVTQFRMRFRREFQERCNRIKKIGDKIAEVDVSSLGQELVGDEDPNESLKCNAMASRLRQYCDEELLALDQRVGVLVGDADLQSEDNPFTPEAIIDAYKHTCRQLDPSVDVQMVLLKLFDDYVLDEIRGVYKAVNALLVENSILPKIRLLVARGKDGAKAASGETGPVERVTGNVSGAPVMASIPQELTNTDLGSGMNQMDTMTLDIMAILFDDLFDDRKIPTAVKGLIGRLQTPMLKLAIADKSFISRKSHPARQLLHELSEFSAHLPADISESDLVYRKLESILQSLIEGFEDDIKIFDDVRQQLNTLTVEMNGRAEQRTPTIVRQVEQQEKLALAKTAAQEEIKVRVRARAAPQPIVRFLTQQWVRLLVVVHVKEGEESESWKNALRTVDLLLWSGNRKETVEERRKMVEVLPRLLKSLADGLAYVGTDDEIRVKFFADLRKLHAEIIDQPEQPSVEAPSKESVIESGSEHGGTDVASGKPGTVGETGASHALSDSEAAATIAKPDNAETSDTAEKPDALPMRDKPAGADTSHEIKLDLPPAGGETAEIPELTDTATVKAATPGEKSSITDSLSATRELEAAAEKPAAQDAAPDDAAPIADSPPLTLEFETGLLKPAEQDAAPADATPIADSQPLTLEFEAGLLKPGEQDAAPADAAPIADSPPLALELEAGLAKPGEQCAAPADAAHGAKSVLSPPGVAVAPEQGAGPPAAGPKVPEGVDRMQRVEPEPKLAAGTAGRYTGLSAQLRDEMDKAMEATRTLFSDVDRFLILGQVQNAVSLLDFRITREPTDRESWVKLMAVYRDEDMDDDFDRTYAAFREQFGDSTSS